MLVIWLVYILTFLLVLLSIILLLPLEIEADTRSQLYTVRYRGVFAFRVTSIRLYKDIDTKDVYVLSVDGNIPELSLNNPDGTKTRLELLN